MRKRRQLPTLHKSFAFLVLLVVLTIIEEAVVGVGCFVIRRLCGPTEPVLNHTWRPGDGTCKAQ
jgi:hypothetical protein